MHRHIAFQQKELAMVNAKLRVPTNYTGKIYKSIFVTGNSFLNQELFSLHKHVTNLL